MTKVLMYSGGMDSFIIRHTYNIDLFVFVRLGNDDNLKELDLLNKVDETLKVEVVNLPISRFELPNKILPFRNHMLAMIGAQFGNEIYFGFTGGDTTKDKDFVFKSQIEGMLNYFALDSHKVNHEEYPYTIHMPYKDSSKGMMVNEYIENDNDVSELLTNSRSCYSSGDKECGKCRSCHRKYVALAVNGIDVVGDLDLHEWFEHDPRTYLPEFLKESESKGRFEPEINEIKAAIENKVMYYHAE